jgi:Tfp pilus assembly protein PilO
MTIKDIPVLLKKYPFSATCGLISVVLAGGYFFRSGSVPEAEVELKNKTEESRRLRANISNAAQLKEHFDALNEANQAVSGRLMNAADLAKNQQYFYKIEADAGVKLTDLRPGSAAVLPGGKPAPKTFYATVPYASTVDGTYEQLLSFLRKLEAGEHFQRIVSANVMLGGQGAEEAGAIDPILSLTIAVEFLGRS